MWRTILLCYPIVVHLFSLFKLFHLTSLHPYVMVLQGHGGANVLSLVWKLFCTRRCLPER